jgi:hypothetical protein
MPRCRRRQVAFDRAPVGTMGVCTPLHRFVAARSQARADGWLRP